MCHQVVAAVVIAAAQTAVQSSEANRQRDKAEAFRKRKELQERSNALAAQRIANAEIQAQQIAESDAAALEIEGTRRAAARAKGTAQVVAGEAGAFGRSYEGLIGEFERQQAEFEGSVQTNLAVKRQFANLNLQSAALNTRARLANSQLLPTPKPNFANFAIQGIGSGFSIAGSLGNAGAFKGP